MLYLKSFLPLFGLYIALGLSTEAIFTGIADAVRQKLAGKPNNWELPCRTWLWSILVFGLSATIAFSFIGYFTPQVFLWPWWKRGLLYTGVIYGFEYLWGSLIEALIGRCPWQYTDSRYRFWRFLNMRYCLFWFGYGFVLEWVRVFMLPRLLC